MEGCRREGRTDPIRGGEGEGCGWGERGDGRKKAVKRKKEK